MFILDTKSISMATPKNLVTQFLSKMRSLWKYVFNTILYKVSIYLVPKFECKVYQNGKNRIIKH